MHDEMSLTTDKEFLCPYCGSENTISVDAGQGRQFALLTDCEICCRPIVVQVRQEEGDCILEAHAENE